ncbi:hypothetical protein ASG54_07615 [Aureimonas sp. Leaf460]|nr:hypothetical protein ASG62_13765 [Aureimonas sp. Leaf427]KQT80429.1 hypothetical protein ASG54_07615 [Aureimonas sp. Leaf460]
MPDDWMAGLSGQGLAFVVLAAFLAGSARGFSGFGAALIFIPLASAVVGPKLASATLLVVDAILTLGMLPAAFRLADRREVATMALGAVVGVPLGTLALAVVDPVLLRWAICSLAFLLLLFLISGWRYLGRPHTALTVGVGGIAGVFSGAAQLGGSPVVAYWLSGSSAGARVRANVIAYFAVSTVISIASYLVGGLFEARVFLLCALAAPTYAIGLRLGSTLHRTTDERHFRRVCFVLIGASAVAGLPLFDGLWRS